MSTALIGHSGFVGGTLQKQRRFDALYRSTDIAGIDGRSFETVWCAAAPAQKWLANRDPDGDRERIDGLIRHLERVICDRFILISTVDVFRTPFAVNEETPVDESGLHPYGLNRRRLERFVERQFPQHLIVRLPGLVGPDLRKNVIYDLHHRNSVESIDSRSVFQFYPMVNLAYDVDVAFRAGLQLVHLTSEPVSVSEVAESGFGRPFRNEISGSPPTYDMRTIHAGIFGASGAYQYSRRESLLAVRAYAQSEPTTAKGEGA